MEANVRASDLHPAKVVPTMDSDLKRENGCRLRASAPHGRCEAAQRSKQKQSASPGLRHKSDRE
jgi:hypothetical protein